MLTRVEIDAPLLEEASKVSGLTNEAAVDQALRLLIVDCRRRQAISDIAGIGWEGDLDLMRGGLAGVTSES